MASKGSTFENTWADQWDSEPAYEYNTTTNKDSGSAKSSSKFSVKIGGTVDKTKAVASTGVKKVKSGASAGVNWIKDKLPSKSKK
ncbi:OLC1v1028151C1 [Oldenlandia corymbosa var. corymbosa]|uniref:OLC1v1028151C1 n=1 Tax=Oldenlandia corymbosa var. corymbosa TaxID=529605 RepID=A0AAV1CDS6_OLDCO|nr:OLC1v1028151C1 [Oldenlandia corymbosa var. corymbosa]